MTITSLSERVFREDILPERARQDAAWGWYDGPPLVYLAALVEEVGEVARALHDVLLAATPKSWWTRLWSWVLRHRTNHDLKHARAELVQVCALSMQMIERLDAGRMPWR